MGHFCINTKPQSSESESFSKERELGKCLTGERFYFFYPSLLQEALLSPSYRHAALETGRQPDLTAIGTEML